jgi:drug/metabolite transporter (DMT)-like permease
MNWILPIFLLIFFELIADILAKEWSLNKPVMYAVGALLAYLIANTFWLFALKNGSGLARGAVIFSVSSALIATLLGIFLYKEELTSIQIAGVILGLMSILLIFWNE